MQKSKQILSNRQQNKFQQLQLEVAALEARVENALKAQFELANFDSQPIPLIYVDECVAKSGIKLTHETAY